VLRGLSSAGHGVESVEALAGTGKTFTAGLLARAYETAGYRVLGTRPPLAPYASSRSRPVSRTPGR
jgi:AAA domain